VVVADNASGEEATYQIVGADEADIRGGRLSITAPLARAIIGKGPGDTVEVNAPSGARTYEIVSVEYR
jgi:transcription elongation factor GreA